MKQLEWLFILALYIAAGKVLPWWAPSLVGAVVGLIRFSETGLIWKQALAAAGAAAIPAVMADISSGGHTSLALAGLSGVQFHPIGYALSLSVAALLAALGSSCGSSFRGLWLHIRERATSEE